MWYGGEAILRDSGGLCNLTEVVIRSGDTLSDLKRKVRDASILGTLQSSLNDFRYLRKVWKDNQDEERLLGISLTGIMDNQMMSGRMCDNEKFGANSLPETLKILKEEARKANEETAKILGIPASKQLTLVKPSGTVSQLCNTASGIHPRHSQFYLRRVTQDIKDPLTDLMIDEGVPSISRGDKVIFTFPIKAPEGSVTSDSMGAIEQLELFKVYQEHWCEGNPSQTVYYTDDEFLDVQSWVWKNWDSIGGVSFFPKSDYIYDVDTQPYLEISEEEYEEYVKGFPTIDWSRLPEFEKEDCTTSSQEYACQGGACEL